MLMTLPCASLVFCITRLASWFLALWSGPCYAIVLALAIAIA